MPYTQCVKISVGMPGGRPMVWTTCRNGIITAWYGMNMPNRISVNTTSAPGNRQRDRTNPLADPISDEMSATRAALDRYQEIFTGFGDAVLSDLDGDGLPEILVGEVEASHGGGPPAGEYIDVLPGGCY